MNLQKNKAQSGLQKALRRALWALIYALPAVLFFSYYPIISLGSNSSMNFELSLPLLWLILFDATAFLSLISLGAGSWRQFSKVTKRASTRAAKSDSPVRTGAGAGHFRKMSSWIDVSGQISDRRFFLFALFPLYATLSIFWSMNPLRAILTAGIIWLLFFAIFAIIYILPLMSPPKSFKTHLLATFFISAALVCVFCFIQSILDACGLSRETTLLCAGCTSYSFGFPHPSGFAIEPQFMGNLLLAPTLTALYLLTFPPKISHTSSAKRLSATKIKNENVENDGSEDIQNLLCSLAACLFSTTLFFTFSRGAIYAYAVALAILLIFSLARRHFRWTLITIPVCTFLLSLGLQGAFSALGPTSETFTGGVTKSIHQLSLGLIDLRSLDNPQKEASTLDNSQKDLENPTNLPENPSTTSPDAPETPSNHNLDNDGSPSPAPSASAPDSPESSIFEGYVAESTNARLNLNKAALDTWLSAPGHPQSSLSVGLRCHFFLPGTEPSCTVSAPLTPTSVFFGVGLGAAGTALYRNSLITDITSPKEIVQNQFFSLLLELGLVGIALALFTLLLAFFPNIFPKKFLDGRAADLQKAAAIKNVTDLKESASLKNSVPSKAPKLLQNPFFQHPALPLLASLIIAYLITLNFFSGLPNALHIYLLPPLVFFTFSRSTVNKA